MTLLSQQIQKLINESPYDAGTVGSYPSFLIDPCILPLKDLQQCKAEGYGKYRSITLNSARPLPHGHYARLIIAHLTTEICKRPERPSLVVASSVSDFFKQVTGQSKISMGTYNNFLLSLKRTFDTTFTVTPTKKSDDNKRRRGFFADADNMSVGQYNAKYKKVLYSPSCTFKKLIADNSSIVPVDLRFLQLARSKDIVLAHDLYIYLVRRGYNKKSTSFVPWKTLHEDVFPNLDSLSPSRFKRRFMRALDFILRCHPHARIYTDKRDNGILISPNNNMLRKQRKNTS